MTDIIRLKPETRIAAVYLIMGFLWILFSGELVFNLAEDAQMIAMLEKYKGWFFIVVTGMLLFLLIRRESRKQKELLDRLSVSQNELIMNGAKLEEQNKQLKEYAFITSHNLRRPLANILGLVQLFDKNKSVDPDNKFAIEKITEMAEELDHLIRMSGSYLKTDLKEKSDE